MTDGVTRGILLAHDRGIVSSTTILMNLPLSENTVKEIKKRRRLGLGIHLNVTLGMPLNKPSEVKTLIKPEGRFRRPADYLTRMPSAKDVVREYEAQIKLFVKRFGKAPDHLDTHHHLHDDPLFFKALATVARKWKVPVRRSRIFQLPTHNKLTNELKTTDYLFGNLEARFIWQRAPFLGVVENLPDGTSEVGCHPGFCDVHLRELSSMQDVREKELRLFSDKAYRKLLSNLDIELIRFSEI